MSKTAITSPELAPPVGPFPQAVKIDGFLFFNGQVAQDPATERFIQERKEETRRDARTPLPLRVQRR